MKLVTERTLIRSVAANWRRQYPNGSCGRGQQLAALNAETATAAEVIAIIGNDSWIRPPACTECKGDAQPVVEVGEEPDYDSDTAYLCRACLQNALALLDGT